MLDVPYKRKHATSSSMKNLMAATYISKRVVFEAFYNISTTIGFDQVDESEGTPFCFVIVFHWKILSVVGEASVEPQSTSRRARGGRSYVVRLVSRSLIV